MREKTCSCSCSLVGIANELWSPSKLLDTPAVIWAISAPLMVVGSGATEAVAEDETPGALDDDEGWASSGGDEFKTAFKTLADSARYSSDSWGMERAEGEALLEAMNAPNKRHM